MEVINQPFSGQLGNRLIEFLSSPDYHTLNIVVAFAKNSGVLRIKDHLELFRARGGVVNAYVGVDLGGTSYEALKNLLLSTDSLYVVHSENGQTFHSKIYQFLGLKKSLVAVGSHNLTGGGLWTNFESSVIIPVENSRFGTAGVTDPVLEYLGKIKAAKDLVKTITTQSEIDDLLEHNYVFKEVSERVRLAKERKENAKRQRLFGGGVPVNIPRIQPQERLVTEAAATASDLPNIIRSIDDDQTIWFETRSMTGGSRNILDLSMRSLIERGDPQGTPFDLGETKFMRGAVEFFGLSPANTGQTKDIVLNFEGVDYLGNTILFPGGENANGTWRLQIKGSNSDDVKITDAFRAKGEASYLVNKVVTFTKVRDDYFFLSVFPQGDLDGFKEVSKILARNGGSKSAKLLGIL